MGDARDGLSVAEFVLLALVEVLERVERGATEVAGHAGRVVREEHGVALAAALYALEDRWDEARAPAALATAGLHAVGNHRDEARKVLVLGAEAVGGPRAHRRTALAGVAGEEQEFGGRVVELIRVHRLHDCDVVGDFLEVRDGVAHPESALAVLLEGARGTHELGHAGREGEGATFEEGVRTILGAPFYELGLVVEDIQVGRATGHVQVDDALGLSLEVRLARGERVIVGGGRAEGVRLHGMQGDGAEAELADAAEEGAAGL